jgi:DNA primase
VISVAKPAIDVEIAGHSVQVSNPDKVYFPARGETKLDLVHSYLAVSEGALRGVDERPAVLKRFPDGTLGDPNFCETVPEKRPDRLETVRVSFPSGRSADELCPVDAAHLVWTVNLGCLDRNPWRVRRDDVAYSLEPLLELAAAS